MTRLLPIVRRVDSEAIRRKRLRDAVLDFEQRYRAIVAHTPLGVLVFDRRGVVTECNSAFSALIGGCQEYLVRGSALQSRMDGLHAAVSAALEGHPTSGRLLVRRIKEDTVLTLGYQAVPIRSSSGEVSCGMCLVWTDRQER